VTALRHGCEGAFIGGICDAFAIWKVFVQAERHYEDLAEGVAETVIEDFIRPEAILQELKNQLERPQLARDLLEQTRAALPEDDSVKQLLGETWELTAREPVIDWIVAIDPRDTLSDPDGLVRTDEVSIEDLALHRDPVVRDAITQCLRYAVADQALGKRLYHAVIEQLGSIPVYELPALPVIKARARPVTLESVIRFALKEEDVNRRLIAAVDAVFAEEYEDEDTEIIAAAGEASGESPVEEVEAPDLMPMLEVLRDYLVRYFGGWHAMSEAERRLAAERFVDRLAPSMVAIIAAGVVAQRDRLEDLVQENLPLNAHPIVELFASEVEAILLTNLPSLQMQSQELLAEQLKSLGPKEFRAMLERRTRDELDWIQVNGAGLGGLLGLTIGLVSAFL
jgi:hypothetical protein